MRRCAMHGSEVNCPAGMNCPGLMNGTDALDDFAEVVADADKLPPQDSSDASAAEVGAPTPMPTYDEALAQLKQAGYSEENARIVLDASGSYEQNR